MDTPATILNDEHAQGLLPIDDSNVVTKKTGFRPEAFQALALDSATQYFQDPGRSGDTVPLPSPDKTDRKSRYASESVPVPRKDAEHRVDLEARAALTERTSTDEGYASMKSQTRAIGQERPTYAPSVAEPGFDHPTTAALVSLFVHDIVQNLPDKPGEKVLDSAMSMPSLIRHYALLLGNRATSSIQDAATRFVRYYRNDIAGHLSEAVCATEGRTEVPTSQQRMEILWGIERTHRSDEVDHLTADDEDDQEEVPAPHIPDVSSARTFLVDSDEFQWLLSRTVSEAGLVSTGTTYADIRTQLIDIIGPKQDLHFVMDWDPWAFCREQYSGLALLDIGKVICLSGGSERAHAQSCGDYLTRVWPTTAALVLHVVNRATSEGYGQYQASTLSEPTHDCRVVYHSSDMQLGDQYDPPETCWHRMFQNPAIAAGYPIPIRTHGQQGLEVPLDMMARLGETPRVVLYDDVTILKGFSSLFAPTRCVGDSIVWHYLVNRNGSRISHNDGEEASRGTNRAINSSTMETARHFVGWTANAEQMAGSDNITYATDWSGTESAKAPFASMSSLGISVGKIVGGSANFIRGKKDTPTLNNSNRIYMDKVKAAGGWTVVFYDRLSRRAWLLDGTSALLHISRAWLVSHKHDLDEYAEANADSHVENEIASVSHELGSFYWPGKPAKFDGQRSARLALYNEKNRQLRVWKTRDSKTETTTDVNTGLITVSEKVTETWTCWQDIVDEKFSMLELVHDHMNKNRNCPTADVKVPFRDRPFEGYEFKDMVAGASLLHPRMVELHPTAGNWPKWSLKSDTIPIFGSDFGEMIRPAKTSQGLHGCGQTSLLPGGLDYLAAPINVLASLRSRTGAAGHGGIALGDSVAWREPWSCFSECHCRSRRNCLVKVARLDVGKLHIGRAQTTSQAEEAVLKQYSRGAIVFGDEHAKAQDVSPGLEYVEPNRLKRCTQQISDSGYDEPSPSLDVPSSQSLPSFQDSGVYVSSPSSHGDDSGGTKRQRLEEFEAASPSERWVPLRDQTPLVCEASQAQSSARRGHTG
ncbi:hypothetical protein LTR17_001527 [Elasticomyces elasticus]|nr:hypothetical protein LTR17_001527 [Elasticomyces elasticus]